MQSRAKRASKLLARRNRPHRKQQSAIISVTVPLRIASALRALPGNIRSVMGSAPVLSLEIRTYVDEPAKSKLVLELWQGDERVGGSEMDADGLDRLITHLGRQREKLVKKIPVTLEDGERIRGQREPEWMCVCAKETDDQVPALRHAGFGWLGFQLSAKTARAMATALLNGSSGKLGDIFTQRGLH
jgi:glycine/D-amino acid oxidase-like deaminating enzyme